MLSKLGPAERRGLRIALVAFLTGVMLYLGSNLDRVEDLTGPYGSFLVGAVVAGYEYARKKRRVYKTHK
jgi:hypothetical protein